MAQINPKTTNIAINAKGVAMTNIALTILASKVEVMEDPALNGGVPQGLTGYYIDNQPPQPTIPIVAGGGAPPQASPANLQVWLPPTNGQNGRAYQPIIFGGDAGRVRGGEGDYVGAQGTVVLQLTSNSPLASGIILTEWP
jgi:hypothetical protein